MHKRSRDRGVRTPCGTYYGVAPGHATRSTTKKILFRKGSSWETRVCLWLARRVPTYHWSIGARRSSLRAPSNNQNDCSIRTI